MPGSAREEAERLVAAVLAMASTSSGKGEGLGALGDLVGKLAGATLGHGAAGSGSGQGSGEGHGSWATGSAECCVCPVCRVIAAMRDPSPDAAARLAIGAGDLANGVASMMRALSSITGDRPAPAPKPTPQRPSSGEAWSAATRAPSTAGDRINPEKTDKNGAEQAWAAATNRDSEADPWGAASAADAETVRAERRAAAKAAAEAAAEAARRVEEAAAQARAARATREAARTATTDADVAQNTTPEVAPGGRTPRRFDVWAAATADAGADEPAPAPAVDHEEHGGVTGDDAV